MFDVIGVLLGVAALGLVFMITPTLFLAPLGLIFSITSLIKNKDKGLAKMGVSLGVVALLIDAGLIWFWSGIGQIGP